jgi:hypothetical protein
VSEYPHVTYMKEVRLPNDLARRCGSGCAHEACRYAGKAEGYLLNCEANGPLWSACPYHATGFIHVPADEVRQ